MTSGERKAHRNAYYLARKEKAIVVARKWRLVNRGAVRIPIETGIKHHVDHIWLFCGGKLSRSTCGMQSSRYTRQRQLEKA